MKSSIIVCTKDRPRDLERFIHSLIIQSSKPNEIVLIDNGNIFNKKILDIFSKNKISYQYVKNKKNGTSLARNIGIKKAMGSILFFFDDDVVLDKNYIKRSIECFTENKKKNVAIVVGKIQNSKNVRMKFIKKIFQLYKNEPYYVLPSGKNIVNTLNFNKEKEVCWASGGVMAIKKNIAQKFRFDESFDYFGYGLGEDLDFTYRVGINYKIIYCPRARLQHLHSNKSRIDKEKLGFIEIVNWYRFFNKNLSNSNSYISFYWGVIGHILINIFSIVLKQNPLKLLLGNLKGLNYIKSNKFL